MPILKTFGYNKIDYYGGPYERGRDIICWKTDEIGQPEAGAVQVKKYKPTAKSSKGSTFSEIVTQLQQATETPIPNINGQKYIPSNIYFITPYQIDTRELESRFEKYSQLRPKRVKIIDGILLLELIQNKTPHLFAQLAGNEHLIQEYSRNRFTNKELFSALNYHSDFDVSNYYSDLMFGIGRISTKFFFTLQPQPKQAKSYFNKEEWEQIKTISRLTENTFNTSLLDKTIEEVESNYNQIHKLLAGKLLDANENIERILALKNTSQYDISERHDSIMKKHEFEKQLKKLQYEAIIQGEYIAKEIKKAQNWLSDQVNNDKFHALTSAEIKTILNRCFSLFETTEQLLSNDKISESIGISGEQKFKNINDIPKINISIQRFFDTRVNFLLLGEAGAGKTTSLYIYAKNKIDSTGGLYIFLPLTTVLHQRNKRINVSQPGETLSEAISSHLRKQEINLYNISTLFNDNNVTLLLDGLDEVIGYAPWLAEGIHELSEKYPRLQLIVSSRSSNQYTSKIPFIGLTLLPFTDDQIYDFIKNWFLKKDSNKAKYIIDHLHVIPELLNILRSPLLSTVLCVLADNNIPLPRTESRLYEERMRLLLGVYDLHKNINRICSDYQNLELVTRKLAYYLHNKEIRYLKKDKIIKSLSILLASHLDKCQITLAIEELIDPCNILIPMSNDGMYGFGHLRYQEYLAAKELATNRGIDIRRLLSNSWWKGVLILFSQLTDNIDFMITDNLMFNISGESLQTLKMMINARPIKERKILFDILSKHQRLDEIDPLSENDIIFDY